MADVQEIEELIARSPTYLRLSEHAIRVSSTAGVQALVGHLRTCPWVQTLDLRGSRIGPGGAAILAEGLKAHPCLTVLSVPRNGLDPESCTAIITALADGPLRQLVLDGNHAGPKTGAALARLLAAPGCSLEAVSVEDAALGDPGVAALADAVAVNNGLRHLNVAYNGVCGSDCGQRWGAALQRASLLTLNMAGCGITGAGARAFIDGLAVNAMLQGLNAQGCGLFDAMGELGENMTFSPQLRELDLSRNTVASPVEARGFGEALQHARRLVALSLNGIAAGDASMAYVLNGTCSMGALQHLDVSHCGMSHRSMPLLADVLSMCGSLRTLLVDGNRIEGKGAAALSIGLAHATELRVLSLADTAVGSSGMRLLAAKMERLPLQTLCVRNIGIDAASAAVLLEALAVGARQQLLERERAHVGTPHGESVVFGEESNPWNRRPQLHALDLSRNSGVTFEAAGALGELLHLHPNLMPITVSDTPLSTATGTSLFDTPREWVGPSGVDRTGNDAGHGGGSFGPSAHGRLGASSIGNTATRSRNGGASVDGAVARLTRDAWATAGCATLEGDIHSKDEYYDVLGEATTAHDGTLDSIVPHSVTPERRRALDGVPSLHPTPLERAATSTNTAVSERQLRELFEEADVRHRGYLVSDELWPLFATATGTSRTDTDGAARVFRSMLTRYGDRGRITFEAFAVIMLHAASL